MRIAIKPPKLTQETRKHETGTKVKGNTPKEVILIDLLTNILIDLPYCRCDDLHHNKKDYHTHGVDCPVEKRLDANVEKAKAYLNG